MEFVDKDPTLENYWRSIILFGSNTASYKFALAEALYDLSSTDNDFIKIEDLAAPFSKHICEHLKGASKQGTSSTSKFLDTCAEFNNGSIDHDELIAGTIKYGFKNVIDAFHVVNRKKIDKPFFIDDRKLNKGIRITNNFFELSNGSQFTDFKLETDARWRLVEEAWALGISKNLINIEYDSESSQLLSARGKRRVTVTSCRNALNGYQKGKCFYCYKPISILSGSINLGDVDHFIPFTAQDLVTEINGVWNLVLACKECNRGANGKFAQVPSVKLLQRLHTRNEYFISSHLPLRETLIRQTGRVGSQRKLFLQTQYDKAKSKLIHTWEPEALTEDLF